jgi:hypothetical protein
MVTICATALSLACSYSARADKKPEVAYVPSITLNFEVLDTNRQPILYPTTASAGGNQVLEPWTPDKPIHVGNLIKLDVFVATGGGELQDLKVRLDNSLYADITKAPWTATLDTSSPKLGVGYHFLEVWALNGGGKKPESGSKTMTFYVSAAALQTQVAGSVQELAPNGQPSTAADPNVPPVPPGQYASATSDQQANVKLQFLSSADNTDYSQGAPVTVKSKSEILVRRTNGSTAATFVYEITRNGKSVYSTDQPNDADSATTIEIVPAANGGPGFYPGTFTVWVWGVDKSGNIGSPIRADLVIPDSEGAK